MDTAPILPFWLVGPIAGVTMILLAGHLLALRGARATMPASRHRIRTVNGGIMLVAVPMLCSAFSVISPGDARAFTLIWFACIGLLGIIVTLAALDAVNNTRLMVLDRRRLREELGRSIREGEARGHGKPGV